MEMELRAMKWMMMMMIGRSVWVVDFLLFYFLEMVMGVLS
jgi:hypothetical protein